MLHTFCVLLHFYNKVFISIIIVNYVDYLLELPIETENSLLQNTLKM